MSDITYDNAVRIVRDHLNMTAGQAEAWLREHVGAERGDEVRVPDLERELGVKLVVRSKGEVAPPYQPSIPIVDEPEDEDALSR